MATKRTANEIVTETVKNGDGNAGGYGVWFGGTFVPATNEAESKALVRLLRVELGQILIEIGCE